MGKVFPIAPVRIEKANGSVKIKGGTGKAPVRIENAAEKGGGSTVTE